MKLKLAGLLLFSQAAVEATVIDKSNYRRHLCDEHLFVPVPGPVTEESGWQSGFIERDYQVYCDVRGDYEQAVEAASRSRGHGLSGPCLGNQKDMIPMQACIEKHGIQYAQACEILKEDRANYKASWNEVVPTLSSCNNARRR
jgi:hypothetical protein